MSGDTSQIILINVMSVTSLSKSKSLCYLKCSTLTYIKNELLKNVQFPALAVSNNICTLTILTKCSSVKLVDVTEDSRPKLHWQTTGQLIAVMPTSGAQCLSVENILPLKGI